MVCIIHSPGVDNDEWSITNDTLDKPVMAHRIVGGFLVLLS